MLCHEPASFGERTWSCTFSYHAWRYVAGTAFWTTTTYSRGRLQNTAKRFLPFGIGYMAGRLCDRDSGPQYQPNRPTGPARRRMQHKGEGKMEFLVNIKIEWPETMEPNRKAQIIKDEQDHAARLAKDGNLVRMWRVPGRRENWGLWRAGDATQLHEIIASLPVFPWMNVTVLPLAVHPVDPLREQLAATAAGQVI